jgi:TM2 domain-containing membrane protein YozV
MSEKNEFPLTAPDTVHLKSIRIAYLLLVFTGFVGGHRIYLGRWLSGSAYLLFLFAALLFWEISLLMAFGLALVVDAFLLPGMTAAANDRISARLEQEPHQVPGAGEQDIAPWAREEKTGFWYAVKGPVRVLSFLLLPMLYTVLMVEMGNYELIVLPVVILMATGLVTSLDEIADRHSSILELPGVETALEHVNQLKTYYRESEPLLRTPFLRVFTRAHTEFKPYWKIVALMVLAVLLDLVFSYSDDYGSYLEIDAAWPIIALHLGINAYAILILLSQLSALSFHYSLSGKRIRLRIMTLLALALTGLTFFLWVTFNDDPGEMSLLSDERLSRRMENEDFREALVDYSSMFIMYYLPEMADSGADGATAPGDRLCDDKQARNLCRPTEWLRELLSGIAPNDESGAFHVFDASHEENGMATLWRGVRYASPYADPPRRVVIAAYSGETLCQNFGFTPEADAGYCREVLERFATLEGEDALSPEMMPGDASN